MGCWVDLEMRRYIILFLITGIVWSQTEFDKLVLKDGTIYLGEYSKTEKEIVYFKPQDAFAFQPVPVNLIKRLKLKDGDYIIGKSIKTKYCCLIILFGFLVVMGMGSNSYHPGSGLDLNYNDADN